MSSERSVLIEIGRFHGAVQRIAERLLQSNRRLILVERENRKLRKLLGRCADDLSDRRLRNYIKDVLSRWKKL